MKDGIDAGRRQKSFSGGEQFSRCERAAPEPKPSAGKRLERGMELESGRRGAGAQCADPPRSPRPSPRSAAARSREPVDHEPEIE